ncbi:hypothetical protein VPH35_108652 [Triticum aestivum]
MDAEIGDAGEAERITEGDWIDTHTPTDAPERDHGLDPGYFAVYLRNSIDRSMVRVFWSGYDFSGIAVTADPAAVSADPMSLPIFLHSVRPYGDIFTIDIDPDDMEKNQDVEEFARVTHSRYENSTPAWTVFSTHDPHAQWNLLVMENYTPACMYCIMMEVKAGT